METTTLIWNSYLVPWGIQGLLALAIFFVGRIVARWICDLLEKQMRKHGLEDMLVQLARNTAYIALLEFLWAIKYIPMYDVSIL